MVRPLTAALPLLMASLWGCGGAPEASAPESTATLPGVLVDSAWLLHNRAPDLLVVDARPHADYARGHIPGAVSLPVAALNGTGSEPASDLASVPSIDALLGGLGLRMDHRVVVYDAGTDYRSASRVFWTLEVHGHPTVAVLDGGLDAWLQTSPDPLQTTAPSIEPTAFVSILQPERLATRLHVLRASTTGDTLLLDTRSKLEYLGHQSAGPRAGHIPMAKHHDFNSNLATDPATGQCTIEDLDTLRAQYADLPPDRKIITYCNSGNRASVTYLALRALALDVAVYDGGWLEWSSDPRLPIQTDAP